MTTSRRLVHWWHDGFHGCVLLTCRVPADAKVGDRVEVSPATAKRLNRQVCPGKGCLCAESAAYITGFPGWQIEVHREYEVVKGLHPQTQSSDADGRTSQGGTGDATRIFQL